MDKCKTCGSTGEVLASTLYGEDHIPCPECLGREKDYEIARLQAKCHGHWATLETLRMAMLGFASAVDQRLKDHGPIIKEGGENESE